MNHTPDVEAAAPKTPGVVSVSGDHLDALARRVNLSGVEWRITVAILTSALPVRP